MVAPDSERRAPYAPISALREFFERIRDVGVPPRVDKRFLEKLNVARSNEWALLSALKFLGIVDEQGHPTHAYRLLQTTDRWQEALSHLVQTAYAPLFEVNGPQMDLDALRNYFRVTSSPSQAKNAARFFREVCDMAGIRPDVPVPPLPEASGQDWGPRIQGEASAPEDRTAQRSARPRRATGDADLVLETKAKLLEKLPPAREEWTAEEYARLCDSFLSLMRNLDGEET